MMICMFSLDFNVILSMLVTREKEVDMWSIIHINYVSSCVISTTAEQYAIVIQLDPRLIPLGKFFLFCNLTHNTELCNLTHAVKKIIILPTCSLKSVWMHQHHSIICWHILEVNYCKFTMACSLPCTTIGYT